MKGRALARDPRTCLCVDLEEPPYGFVQVQGEAELSEGPGGTAPYRHRDRGPVRGAERAEAFGKRNAGPGEYVVRLRPTKVLAVFNIFG